MTETYVLKAAAQFGKGLPEVQPLGKGLMHRTFKVSYSGEEKTIVLQCLNLRTFSQPENIILNYQLLLDYLDNQQAATKIPALVESHQQKHFWVDEEDNFWRATEFIPGTASYNFIEAEKYAHEAARCFGLFTKSLQGLDPEQLHIVIPNFHNLELRYQQFEDAISKAGITRLLRSTHVISELRQRKGMVEYFRELGDESAYPTRIMHHDCKISNILFETDKPCALTPIDLDTVMPGKFFSDIGDMIRTMAATVDENSTAWEDINIRPAYYKAVLSGYMEATGEVLTTREKEDIHYSGALMIYMQSLRFVTDFLNNDIYYKTEYAEQNLNRALNQLILLEKLEDFLLSTYNFSLGHSV